MGIFWEGLANYDYNLQLMAANMYPQRMIKVKSPA